MEESKRHPVLLSCSLIMMLGLSIFLLITILFYDIPKIYIYYNTEKLIPDILCDYKFGSNSKNFSYYLEGRLQDIDKDVRMYCDKKFYNQLIDTVTYVKENRKLPVWYFSPRKVYYRDSEVFNRSVIGETIFKGAYIILIPIFIFGLIWLTLAWREKKYMKYIKQQRLQKRRERKKMTKLITLILLGFCSA